jgi:gamma-tubulin complex component 3
MSQDKSSRIYSAVDSLIVHLVPTHPGEDTETAQERHDNCFELVRSIIDRYDRQDIPLIV